MGWWRSRREIVVCMFRGPSSERSFGAVSTGSSFQGDLFLFCFLLFLYVFTTLLARGA